MIHFIRPSYFLNGRHRLNRSQLGSFVFVTQIKH
uniref:Uncharacterized protein n=1 Tax=Lepeophtheirus salmonis TaxID=72036 RepID=A0A0K2T6P9_LEPSM